MGLSELKAAISLENDSVASNERQRMIKWTVDDVMSHVRALGCTEQAKIFGDQVHFYDIYCHYRVLSLYIYSVYFKAFFSWTVCVPDRHFALQELRI